VSVYSKRGSFQLIVKRLTPAGVGDLKLQLERLKKRLATEGLFDIEHKKAIPNFPKRIGLITAHGSAAYHDFLNVSKRRSLWLDIVVAPAVVQGDKSADSLRQALVNLIAFNQKAPEEKKIDVIVLTRGGGSLEDLWSFNDEALAWEIYNCPVPVISAVGHEVDFSISDYVADKRCETPTAAAEVLTQAQVSLKQRLKGIKRGLGDFGDGIVHRRQVRLEGASPFSMLRKIENRIYHYQRRLSACRLHGRLPELTGIHEFTLRLEDCLRTLKSYPEQFKELNTKIEHHYNMLRLMNPENILGKGYTYIKDESGALIGKSKDFDELPDDSRLNIHFSDGQKEVLKRSSPL
jgi:exodeoxyribonuclease VII large subunit